MKTISLYLWSQCGHDGDGNDSDFEISDADYATLVQLVKEYYKDIDELDEEDIPSAEEFNDHFASTELYKKLYKEVSGEIKASLIENAQDWFSEEDEGCSVEEYINNNYYWGYYLNEEVIEEILGPKFNSYITYL